MTFWYTARKVFGPESDGWKNYVEWSKLIHLKELVSLDGILCDLVFKPDYDDPELWKHIITEECLGTVIPFFTSLDYVLSQPKEETLFNLFTVVKDPDHKCENLQLEDYEFVGYDLIDCYFDVSALTNCGGFDESFLPQELNHYGLINDYEHAYDVATKLLANNPDETHADCYVFAVWRHKIIGQQNIKK